MVERFFADITRNRIRRGALKSVAQLIDANAIPRNPQCRPQTLRLDIFRRKGEKALESQR